MNLFVKKLVVFGSLAYLAILGLVFFIGNSTARVRVEGMLDSSVELVCSDMKAGADVIIAFMGKTIVSDCENPESVTDADIVRYMRGMRIDELNFIDKNGRFVRSSEHDVVIGQDFFAGKSNRTVDYSQLFENRKSFVVEAARGSVEKPWLRRKYGGFAFPNGSGFVQIGIDEKRMVTDFGYVYEQIAVNWNVGELGYFIIADAASGIIRSTLHESNCGKPLTVVTGGPFFSKKDFSTTIKATVFGETCYVRDGFCQGYRVLVVLPEREFLGARDVTVLSSAVILFILFAAFGLMMNQINERNRQMERFFEKERQQAEKDLMMAKDIQSNALPTVFPPFPLLADRIDLFAMMRTAKEVGGDFYDFYMSGDHRLAIVIADVSGKGVPAAMFMMRAKSTLQGLLRGGGDIAEAVTETNARLSSGNEANMFVTAWIGVVDLESGEVEYVNAGHNPPVLKRFDGGYEWLKERSGPPLASFDGVTYRKRTCKLKPGDGIFLYTDGVTEAVNAALELYGEGRLMGAFTAKPSDPAEPPRSSRQLCADLLADIDGFVSGMEQADDITMLAFKLNGVERTFPANDIGMAGVQPYLEMFESSPKPAIIMDEIVSNIVRCSGAHTFSVRFVRKDDGLEMTFVDDGVAFDPITEIKTPDVSAAAADRDIGGLGIFMVKKMAKSLHYEREDGKNRLTVLL